MGRRAGGSAVRGVSSSRSQQPPPPHPWACSSLSSSNKFQSLYDKMLEDWEARNFESLVCTRCLQPEQPAVPIDKPGSSASQIVVFPQIISRGSVVGKKVYCSTSVHTTMTHRKKKWLQGGIHNCPFMFPDSAHRRRSGQPLGSTAEKSSQREKQEDDSLDGMQCRGLFLSLAGAVGMRLLCPPLQLPLLEILLFSTQTRAALSHKGGLWRLPFNLALATLRPFCGTLVRRCLTALLFIVQMNGKQNTPTQSNLTYTPDLFSVLVFKNTHLDHLREFTICSSITPIACPEAERVGWTNDSLCSVVGSFYVEECGGQPIQISGEEDFRSEHIPTSPASPLDLVLEYDKYCSPKRSLQQPGEEFNGMIPPHKRLRSTEQGLDTRGHFQLEHHLPTSLEEGLGEVLVNDLGLGLEGHLVADLEGDLGEDEGLESNPSGKPTYLGEGRPSGRAVEQENEARPTQDQEIIGSSPCLSLERLQEGQADVCICAQDGLERVPKGSLGEVGVVEQGGNNRLSSRGLEGVIMVSQHGNSSPEKVLRAGAGRIVDGCPSEGTSLSDVSSSKPCLEGSFSEARTEYSSISRLHTATTEAAGSQAALESDSPVITVVLGVEKSSCDPKDGPNGIPDQCLEILDEGKESEYVPGASTTKHSLAALIAEGGVEQGKQEDTCFSEAGSASCSPLSCSDSATMVLETETYPHDEFADHPTCIDLRERRHSHGDQTYMDMQDLLPSPWGQLIFWHGRCKEGRPTLCVMLGKAVRQLPSQELKHFIAVTVSHIEYAELNFFKGPVKQMNIVMDLEGLGFMRLPPMNILSSIGAVLNRDYAGRGGWIILVNAPVMLGFVISAIQGVILRPSYNKGAVIDSSFRGFLEGKERIMMMGSKYRPVLQKHFDASMLPTALGGDCPCSSSSDEASPCKLGSEYLRLSWNSSSSI